MQTLREPERYLEALDRIRILQNYLVERAEAAGVPVIEASGTGLETMWRRCSRWCSMRSVPPRGQAGWR